MSSRKKEPQPVTVVPVQNSRQLVTIGPDSPLWNEYQDLPKGCIVRIIPPINASPEQIGKMREWSIDYASSVRVMPQRKASVVTSPKQDKPHAKSRDVVMGMVVESNFEEKEELKRFVEDIADIGEL